MTDKIARFNRIIQHHNQYSTDSKLWSCIKWVFDCSDSKAKKRAKSYCNVISFYALCYVTEKIDMDLTDFISYGISSGIIRKDGFIKSKSKLLHHFNSSLDFKYATKYDDCDDLEKGFYQIKIKSRSGGWHFIGGYKDDDFYISDTSNRGIAVKFKDVISKNQLKWVLRIK